MSVQDDQSSRGSVIDAVTYAVPLLRRRTSVSDSNPDDASTTTRTGCVGYGFVAASTALVLGTGLSFTGCQFMASNPRVLSTSVSGDQFVLRRMGLKHGEKRWSDYTQDMVDYISSRSYAALSSGPENNTLSPLVAASFSHFPENEHSALGALLPNDVQHWADVHWTIAYSQYMDVYDRSSAYHDSEDALLQRFVQYQKNGVAVYNHNKRSTEFAPDPQHVDYLYTLELNQFADMREEDFSVYLDMERSTRSRPTPPENATELEHDMLSGSFVKLPDEFSWKSEGCIQQVKNQLHCGSCWAFSAIESLESAVCVARKSKKGLLSRGLSAPPGPVSPDVDPSNGWKQDWVVSPDMPNLSEQQLVDCALKEGNHGCHGGMMEFAFQYAIDNSKGEICTEDSYSYVGEDGVCHEKECTYEQDWKVVSWNHVSRFSPSSLQKAIMNFGVIAVSVEADNPMFMMYKSGVVHDGKVGDSDDKQCGTALNHGVAVVGWGNDLDSGEPFWLVKNSWGPQWGEDGFIRLARDSGGMFGECGILMDASYPIIKAYTHPSY